MQEAYSAEEFSCGFWPAKGLGEAAFYSYAYPEPAGYKQYPIHPAQAYYHPGLGEFILPYNALRSTSDWEAELSAFFQSTYEAEANLAGWDRETLEQNPILHPGQSSVQY